ncbi:MAG: hypothetical protein DWH91_09960 [Planctomycetota bacterium]|nr:MAG: hypothetical protein DWH91_09960 [Planctomycetota bacterium]
MGRADLTSLTSGEFARACNLQHSVTVGQPREQASHLLSGGTENILPLGPVNFEEDVSVAADQAERHQSEPRIVRVKYIWHATHL